MAATIIIDIPANVPVPPTGEVTLFLNADANNRLYYKNELGGSYPANVESEDCCCTLAQEVMSGIVCALKNGNITMTEFNAFVAAGMVISGETTDDGAGNTTCSVTINAAP